MENVLEQCTKIVDIFMNDKKEERFIVANEIIGLISKKNIEISLKTLEMT